MKKYYLKEDVEFERLKEFGFTERIYGYYRKCLNTNIFIWKNDINNKFLNNYTPRAIMYEDEIFNDLYLHDENVIQDLIKANLVEERDE